MNRPTIIILLIIGIPFLFIGGCFYTKTKQYTQTAAAMRAAECMCNELAMYKAKKEQIPAIEDFSAYRNNNAIKNLPFNFSLSKDNIAVNATKSLGKLGINSSFKALCGENNFAVVLKANPLAWQGEKHFEWDIKNTISEIGQQFSDTPPQCQNQADILEWIQLANLLKAEPELCENAGAEYNRFLYFAGYEMSGKKDGIFRADKISHYPQKYFTNVVFDCKNGSVNITGSEGLDINAKTADAFININRYIDSVKNNPAAAINLTKEAVYEIFNLEEELSKNEAIELTNIKVSMITFEQILKMAVARKGLPKDGEAWIGPEVFSDFVELPSMYEYLGYDYIFDTGKFLYKGSYYLVDCKNKNCYLKIIPKSPRKSNSYDINISITENEIVRSCNTDAEMKLFVEFCNNLNKREKWTAKGNLPPYTGDTHVNNEQTENITEDNGLSAETEGKRVYKEQTKHNVKGSIKNVEFFYNPLEVDISGVIAGSCFGNKKVNTDTIDNVLYNEKFDIDYIDNKTGKTALMSAVLLRNNDIVQRLLGRKASPNIKDHSGFTALMFAVGDQGLVYTLLKAGADPNIKNNCGDSALDIALHFKLQAITDMLKKAESGKTAKDLVLSGEGFIHTNDADALINSLKAGIDINSRDRHGDTALISAVEGWRKEIIEILINSKADINAQNNRGTTALMEATRQRKKEIVEMLLKAGANPNIRNNEGNTALDIISAAGYSGDTRPYEIKEITDILLKLADNNTLELRKIKKSLDIFEYSLKTFITEKGLPKEGKGKEVLAVPIPSDYEYDGEESFYYGTSKYNIACFGIKCNLTVSPNTPQNVDDYKILVSMDEARILRQCSASADNNPFGNFCNKFVTEEVMPEPRPEEVSGWNLLNAAKKGNLAAIKYIVGKGIDVNFQGWGRARCTSFFYHLAMFIGINACPKVWRSNTALITAADYNQKEAVALLLSLKADPDLQNGDHITALLHASEKGNREIVEILLKAGANPNIKDKWHKTALGNASNFNDYKMIVMLIKAGAVPNTLWQENQIFINAIIRSDKETLRALLGKTEKPISCLDGWSPLILASALNEKEIVEMLLEAGVDPDETTHKGKTAADIASVLEHLEIVDMLEKASKERAAKAKELRRWLNNTLESWKKLQERVAKAEKEKTEIE